MVSRCAACAMAVMSKGAPQDSSARYAVIITCLGFSTVALPVSARLPCPVYQMKCMICGDDVPLSVLKMCNGCCKRCFVDIMT